MKLRIVRLGVDLSGRERLAHEHLAARLRIQDARPVIKTDIGDRQEVPVAD